VGISRIRSGMAIEQTTGTELSQEDARRLTDEARALGSELWLRVRDLYQRSAHIALGYGSWREYWASEFDQSGTRGEQILRAGRVAAVLQERELPLPANDSTARELVPLLKDPDRLAEVWSTALAAADGKPIGSQVRTLVAPYRRARTGGSTVDGRNVRRLRNDVSRPLRDARGGLEQARKALPDALRTEPATTLVRDWLHHVREIERAARALGDELERRSTAAGEG
jgi:hypothetical protein